MSDYGKPLLDLYLVIDDSRSSYENQQFISYTFIISIMHFISMTFRSRHIAEVINISNVGSSMTVIHGTNGDLLVNRTKSIATVFQQLRNFTGSCKRNTYS